MMQKYGSLAIFLLLVFGAAFLGSIPEPGEWYHVTMNKPSWTPPAWLFGPVWAVLYVMMAAAAWRIWLTGHPERKGALTWWLIQLLANVGWSWLFFGLHRPGWAWLEMALLIGLVVFCYKAFRRISPPAANLLIPYLLWLVFAWILNLAIWTMNGGLFSRLLLG